LLTGSRAEGKSIHTNKHKDNTITDKQKKKTDRKD
jgi:hypothetical protein